MSLYKASRAIFCKCEKTGDTTKEIEGAHEKEKNETGTCRKHDNSGSKTTLKR